MYQIAIVGKKDREIIRLSQALSQTGDFLPTLYFRSDLALQEMGNRRVQGWILAVETADLSQKNLILRIKEIIGDCPLLILAGAWDEKFEEFVEEIANAAIINNLNDRNSISGVLMKMLKGDSVYSRRSQRKTPVETIGFRVNQKTVLVKDLSDNGARFLTVESNLKPGDQVSLEVNLPSVKVAHFVKAEVMWVLSLSPDPYRVRDRQLAGVKFLCTERLSL